MACDGTWDNGNCGKLGVSQETMALSNKKSKDGEDYDKFDSLNPHTIKSRRNCIFAIISLNHHHVFCVHRA